MSFARMFGHSYHCGNCDGLASALNRGKCPTCGSSSIVPVGWYQLSVEERSEWTERINGRRTEIDPYRLDQPGIRETIVLPELMSCTAEAARFAVMSPPRPLARPNALFRLWVGVCAWVSSLFTEEQPAMQPSAPEPVVLILEPAPVARMTSPVRARVRPTRSVVWSREHAPRTRVHVQRAHSRRIQPAKQFGTGPPRRRRLRLA
jgi:hypothetical protein